MEPAIILLYSITGSKLVSSFLKAEDLVGMLIAPDALLLVLLTLVFAWTFAADLALARFLLLIWFQTLLSLATSVLLLGASRYSLVNTHFVLCTIARIFAQCNNFLHCNIIFNISLNINRLYIVTCGGDARLTQK
jgi:hypothetical protein